MADIYEFAVLKFKEGFSADEPVETRRRLDPHIARFGCRNRRTFRLPLTRGLRFESNPNLNSPFGRSGIRHLRLAVATPVENQVTVALRPRSAGRAQVWLGASRPGRM